MYTDPNEVLNAKNVSPCSQSNNTGCPSTAWTTCVDNLLHVAGHLNTHRPPRRLSTVVLPTVPSLETDEDTKKAPRPRSLSKDAGPSSLDGYASKSPRKPYIIENTTK